jgi:hypothetical protein
LASNGAQRGIWKRTRQWRAAYLILADISRTRLGRGGISHRSHRAGVPGCADAGRRVDRITSPPVNVESARYISSVILTSNFCGAKYSASPAKVERADAPASAVRINGDLLRMWLVHVAGATEVRCISFRLRPTFQHHSFSVLFYRRPSTFYTVPPALEIHL